MAPLRVDDVLQTPRGLGIRVHRTATQSKRTSGAVFGPTKTYHTRTVPVPAALDGYVRRRDAGTAPAGYLLPSPTGGVWTNTNLRARSEWMNAARAAGVEWTTNHELRHTAASLLIAAEADVKAVQVILGHSTATMTMDLYGHLFSEATWQAMERLPGIPLVQAPRAIEPPPHALGRH
jgi:integrase